MLRLHQLPALDRAPSLSPFCTKVETYLRMAAIPYETVTTVNPRSGPKGKLPFIEDGDRRVGDSGWILTHLKSTRGDAVDAHLSPRDHAAGHALRRTLEEHFYWALVYSRWFDERHWPRLAEIFLGSLPGPVRSVAGRVALATMKRTMRAHGIGRHGRDEIMAAGNADLDALAETLGDRPFLFGDTPSSYDAVAHAFLSNTLDVDMETPLSEHARSKPALVDYCARMNARYYAPRA
jgi:glutathione S-transferase